MSVVDLQRRARRLGEIRTGTKSDRGHPVKLDTFRLTSPDRRLIAQAADLWGGEVEPWDGKHEVITKAEALPVIVPVQNLDNLVWYERWSGGGLQVRCDGEHIVNHGDPLPCTCDPANRVCNPITRLNLMLPDLADIGVWLLSSTGYNFASEVTFAMDFVMGQMQRTGQLPAASLEMEHREVKRPGEPVKQFTVAVLRFPESLAQLGLPSQQSPLAALDGTTDRGGESVTHVSAPAPVAPLPSSVPSPVVRGEATATETEQTGSATRSVEGAADATPETDGTHPLDHDTVQARLVDYGGSVGTEVIDFPVPEDETWSLLLDTIAEDATEGNMDVVEERVRRLYRLMDQTGLWPGDAIHAALEKHHSVEHLRDLKRSELDSFAKTTWMHAEGKIASADA